MLKSPRTLGGNSPPQHSPVRTPTGRARTPSPPRSEKMYSSTERTHCSKTPPPMSPLGISPHLVPLPPRCHQGLFSPQADLPQSSPPHYQGPLSHQETPPLSPYQVSVDSRISMPPYHNSVQPNRCFCLKELGKRGIEMLNAFLSPPSNRIFISALTINMLRDFFWALQAGEKWNLE